MTKTQVYQFPIGSKWMLKQNLVSIAEHHEDSVTINLREKTAGKFVNRKYVVSDASWLTPVPENIKARV